MKDQRNTASQHLQPRNPSGNHHDADEMGRVQRFVEEPDAEQARADDAEAGPHRIGGAEGGSFFSAKDRKTALTM